MATHSIAAEVKRHIAESVPLPGLEDALAHQRLSRPAELGEVELDSRQVFVPPNAHLPESKRAEIRLKAADLREALARDARSKRNSAGQASCCWFVPDREAD